MLLIAGFKLNRQLDLRSKAQSQTTETQFLDEALQKCWLSVYIQLVGLETFECSSNEQKWRNVFH